MLTLTDESEEGVATAAPPATVCVAAPGPEAVFNLLADVERLPRWAGGFCERVELRRGRWLALTALGELWLEVEADPWAGTVTLRAGPEPGAECSVRLGVRSGPAGGTRVTLDGCAREDGLQRRLADAVEAELRRWATRAA